MNQLPMIVVVTLIVMLAMLACSDVSARVPADGDTSGRPKIEDTPKLTVRGDADLDRPADRMLLSIGVVTEGREAADALAENSTRMNAVVDAIERVGLATGEYETGRFRIRPKYSRRPRQPEPDWQPQIIGYEVTNSINVKTLKLDLAGDLIEAANKAGANNVAVTGFDLADPRQYRAEAIAEATRNAIADAQTLAGSASLELVRILAINLDSTPVPSPNRYAMRAAMADAESAPPITPGDVTVRAGVTIVYEIAPRN